MTKWRLLKGKVLKLDRGKAKGTQRCAEGGDKRGRRCLPLPSTIADDAQPYNQRAKYMAKGLPIRFCAEFSICSDACQSKAQHVGCVKVLFDFLALQNARRSANRVNQF